MDGHKAPGNGHIRAASAWGIVKVVHEFDQMRQGETRAIANTMRQFGFSRRL